MDEFQNFATDSFAVILSQARKYALNLTVANQYIAQMPQEVRDAVFGNVGTIISFRVSPDDAPYLTKYFEPQFEPQDAIQQASRHFITSMMINGEKAPAFSAKTLNLPSPTVDYTPHIIELSRQSYAQPLEVVQKIVRDFMEKDGGNTKQVAASPSSPSLEALPAPDQVARAKAQAQLNHVAEYQSQSNANKAASSMIKAVTGGSHGSESATMQVQEPSTSSEESPKRKRTRRGGRKHKKPSDGQGNPSTQPPASQPEQRSLENDSVIRLR